MRIIDGLISFMEAFWGSAKGSFLPRLVSPPLKEAACAPGPCAGWQREARTEKAGISLWKYWNVVLEERVRVGWAGGLGKLRECPSLPTIPFCILLVPPGAGQVLQLQGGG